MTRHVSLSPRDAVPLAAPVPLPLRVGPRTLLTLKRRLHRRALTVNEARANLVPELPALGRGDHGYWLNGLAVPALASLAARHPPLRPFVRQRYRRHFTDLGRSFEALLASMSGKSRSTLRRKLRRFAKASGGTIDWRAYRGLSGFAEFHRLARPVSAASYQERLFDAGLPGEGEDLEELRALARADLLRAYLLFLQGKPVSYLCLPAEGTTLFYAWLGYDPEHASLSPGTVLLAEALRDLMEEGRFELVDYTEGEGRNKRLFATGSVTCVDALLLRPSLANLVVGHLLGLFDGGIGRAKSAIARLGLEKPVRALLRLG
ncbi:MAG: GNAT family N-acetyltransferase [Sphingomonadaceae bacterium]